MAILNRLLSVLILLVAVAAVVVGVLLFGKRQELRERGNKMALAIEQVGETLARNSGPSAGQYTDKLAVSDDGREGPLGYANFEQLDSNLTQANELAAAVQTQRDELATSMENLAGAMGLGAEVPAGSLTDLEGYKEKADTVAGYWGKVEERDEVLISGIETLADLAGARVARPDVAQFDNPEGVEGQIDKIEARIVELNESRKTLALAIQRVAEAMGRDDLAARAEQLTENEVADLGDDIREQRQQVEDLQSAKEELSKVKANLTEAQGTIETMHHSNQVLEEKIAQLNDQLRMKEDRITQLTALANAISGGTGASKDLAGNIIDVNYEWNYVVIDLGKADELPPQLEMTVARGSEFICKVLVRKVYKDYAVADIMNDLKQGQPIEGDSVIYVASGL